MPGTFIDVQVDAAIAADPELASKLVEVCPVDIFAVADNTLEIVEDHLDECTLCDLCLEVGPSGSVRVVKLYE